MVIFINFIGRIDAENCREKFGARDKQEWFDYSEGLVWTTGNPGWVGIT